MTSARGSEPGGYTLAELLTVIAVLGVLAGMSIGVFATLPQRFSHEAAAASVKALLRRARAAAIESRSEAAVTFEGRRIEARAWAPLALFRFEDVPAGAGGDLTTVGARGLEGRIAGAEADAGRLGNALYFERPGAHVDCGDLPILSPVDGVRIEAWVFPGDFALVRTPPAGGAAGAERPPAPGSRKDAPYLFAVAGKGDAYFLRVREDYAVLGGVTGAGERAATVRETAPGALRPERWAEVALIFDGEDLRILIDGFRRDLPAPRGAKLPKTMDVNAAPLTISHPHPGLSFFGAIDEVRVSGIVAEEAIELGADIAIDAPAAVHFEGRGELDPLYHTEPALIRVSRIASGGGRDTGPAPVTTSALTITVERSGALRVSGGPAGGPPVAPAAAAGGAR